MLDCSKINHLFPINRKWRKCDVLSGFHITLDIQQGINCLLNRPIWLEYYQLRDLQWFKKISGYSNSQNCTRPELICAEEQNQHATDRTKHASCATVKESWQVVNGKGRLQKTFTFTMVQLAILSAMDQVLEDGIKMNGCSLVRVDMMGTNGPFSCCMESSHLYNLHDCQSKSKLCTQIVNAKTHCHT